MTPENQTLYRFAADPQDAGERLDRYLAHRLGAIGQGEISRARVKALIEAGHAGRQDSSFPATTASGTITEPSHRVKPGAIYTLHIPPAREATPQGEAIPLEVIYEDADLIVVDKPPGMVVHPAPGNPDRTLVNALISHCGSSLSGIGGVKRPGIVHRIDKDTSGLLVAAKTDVAHAGLSRQFADHSLERAYCAVVWGRLTPANGEIAGNIGRDPHHRKRMAVVNGGGKPALTRYRTLRTLGSGLSPIASLIECRLSTGRTHQIRVHLSHLGHPLIGDPLYARARRGRGSTIPDSAAAILAGFRRQALHARLLGFDHPVSGRHLVFESELPTDMQQLLTALDMS